MDASKHLEFVLKDMVFIRDLNTEFHSEADCVRVRKQLEKNGPRSLQLWNPYLCSTFSM